MEHLPAESNPTKNILDAIANTQAFRDRAESIELAKQKLAASKGISVEELSPEDRMLIILQTPSQARMVADELFGTEFMDNMDDCGIDEGNPDEK